MKIVYQQLQQLLPGLKNISAKEVASRLTYLGHFNDSLVSQNGQSIIGLEIRQNRADCLSYYGIAKELSVLYGPLSLPSPFLANSAKLPELNIKVETPENVNRIQAIQISHLKNQTSSTLPHIKKILEAHDIHPVNALVDLTNYVMLFWGIPCHAFDTKKSGHSLVWQLNNGRYKKFTTLDGTVLNLDKDTFMVNAPKKALSLSFLGGENCAIDLHTTETIVEMAVYNPGKVRADSRSLKTITEASIRLDKFLDPNLIDLAFNHLISLIITHCHAQVSSQQYNYYPQVKKIKPIKFNPQKPSQIAGVSIKTEFALDILKKLGCSLHKDRVNPPSLRSDLEIEDDLVEEVIRFFGYDKIPLNQPIKRPTTNDITPPVLLIINYLKNVLISLGYDEVQSWPLVRTDQIINKDTVIYTQNSINSDYPVLRQSIIPSLVDQRQQYSRYKVKDQPFFQIGKIYYQEKIGDYQEKYALALYHPNSFQLEQDLDTLLIKLGLNQDQLIDAPIISQAQGGTYIEIILDSLADIIDLSLLKTNRSSGSGENAYELTRQILTLDANLSLKTKIDPKKLLEKYSKKLGKHLWQIIITDIFYDQKKKIYRYTFRVSYFNLSSAKAKSLHLSTFNLN
jgi:phenylalanyl-tRNA synthetase beta chain